MEEGMKKKKVYVALTVDLIHEGHIRLIQEAVKYGDVTVGLVSDEALTKYKGVPIMRYNERKAVVENIKGVKEVVPYHPEDYLLNMERHKPDIVVHGDDWKTGKLNPMREGAINAIEKINAKLIEVPYFKEISSTDIKKRILARNKPRKIKKIMLMQAKRTLFKNDIRRAVPPLGLAYLAAYLEREGYDIKILDIPTEGYDNVEENGEFVTYGLSDEEVRKRIQDFNPDAIGVSCLFTIEAENVKALLKLIKEINPKIVAFTGGSHPTYSLNEMLNEASLDYVIMGEGELPTLQLLDALNEGKSLENIGGLAFRKNGKDFINSNIQFVEDLDTLPFPAWHLLNMEEYFRINKFHNPYSKNHRIGDILTSRGCNAKCIYCTGSHFWKIYRQRSAENIIKELKELKEVYQIDEIQFADDNPTIDKERAIKIFKALKEINLDWCTPGGLAVWTLDEEMIEEMAKSGCYQISLGVENANQDVLSRIIGKPLKLEKIKPIVKKAKEMGMRVHGFFMLGMPGETIQDMHNTFNFAKDAGFDSASFHITTPLPGSRLLSLCQQKGYIKGDIPINNLLFKRGNITTLDFTPEQVEGLAEKFNRDFNKHIGEKY